MNPVETLSRPGKDLLQMSSIDVEKTEWIEWYKNDFIMVHNPVFKFDFGSPYRVGQVMAVFCEEGTASGSINLKPYTLKKNSLLVVLADHIIEAYEVGADFKGTYIFMSPSFLSKLNIGDSYKLYESIEREPCFQLENRMADSVRSYIDMCYTMMQISDQNPNTEESLQLLSRLFFLNLGWFLHHDAIEQVSHSQASNVTEKFLSLVKAHYKEHRDVEYYADLMHMTPKYMSTLVKNASGKSALKWIEEYVILEAKTQLASTLNAVQQIAYDLNFPTQSFFGRYFKRATGLSPLAYRNLVRRHITKTE
ncbi:MAG: helix-turn-helix domain-containing protein [Bacteroidales bacterium]|nr:helix-turn-helix domain-containing protein [Bacteroidales bacterium]